MITLFLIVYYLLGFGFLYYFIVRGAEKWDVEEDLGICISVAIAVVFGPIILTLLTYGIVEIAKMVIAH